MTLASAVEVRVPLVAGVAVAREASIVLPADSILALAKATGYVSEARRHGPESSAAGAVIPCLTAQRRTRGDAM